jgi:hypothetical protein
MKISMRPLLAALALSVAAFSIANSAQAACGFAPSQLKPSAWNPSTQASPTLIPAVYHPGAEGQFLQVSDDGGWRDHAGIVGMWQFQLLALTGAPKGATIDDGYAQWHSDGTEIQNSGLHAPITSNFCLGVWEQTGANTYQLNHFPLGWMVTQNDVGTQAMVPPGITGSPAVAIQITETVHLTDNNHMTGTFTLNVYSWTNPDSLNVASSTPLQTITGTITATRVTIYSTVPGA